MALAVIVATGCAAASESRRSRAPTEMHVVEQSTWAELFDQHGVAGTFALHRLGTDEVMVHDADRASQRVLPASTFKILNSLIALETGELSSVDEIVEWDGVERPIDVWNRDHSLRSGIEVSAVWMYQELARRIGPSRMSAAVREAEYGNADIGGPIDEFWLSGDLRISPLEQLDMLAGLMTDDLPFEPHHQRAVRDILVRDEGDDWRWGHKTGTAFAVDPLLGWLVGFATTGAAEWVFAMNVDLRDSGVTGQIEPEFRLRLARTLLAEADALPPA